MTVEIARNRIAKIRNDLSYSRHDLNNKLGLNNEKEESANAMCTGANWLQIK